MGLQEGAALRKKLDGPTPEQFAHGGYKRGFVMHAETATETMAYVSRHDPVERWKASGRLEPHQLAAIALCQRLWELAGMPINVTASYGERLPGSANAELRAASEIDARKDLHRIQEYVPVKYWGVFENVCRHGEPAGVVGSRLGFGERSGSDRAHQVVCFVADLIAMFERL